MPNTVPPTTESTEFPINVQIFGLWIKQKSTYQLICEMSSVPPASPSSDLNISLLVCLSNERIRVKLIETRLFPPSLHLLPTRLLENNPQELRLVWENNFVLEIVSSPPTETRAKHSWIFFPHNPCLCLPAPMLAKVIDSTPSNAIISQEVLFGNQQTDRQH